MLNMNDKLMLKYKMNLYRSVCLPVITYASKIWFNRVNSKSSYLDRLRLTQRKFLKCLTKVYKCTSNEKLLKILNVVGIIDELNILEESFKLSKHVRKSFKIDERIKLLNLNNIYDNIELFNVIFDSTSRFTLWCFTDTGPFKSTIAKMKLSSDNLCRYCYYSIENIDHLYFSCEKFRNSDIIDTQIEEKRCIYIVTQLLKDRDKLNF